MKQYTIPLFVPFNVRNNIINDSKKDINNFSLKEQVHVLLSYMKESQIHDELEKANYEKLRSSKNRLPLYKMGINHGFSQMGKFEVVERYYQGMGIKNVAFLAAKTTPISDTGLKSYWRFNEASGDIINQSQSAVDLGAGADIQITGATYSDNGSPLGNGMFFDGTNDRGIVGTSLSQWNFLHSTTALWTICFWIRWAGGGDKFILGTGESATGFKLASNTTQNFRCYTVNSAVEICATYTSSANYVPDTTNWYFYTLRLDQAAASNNFKMRRNDGNEELQTKTANTPTNGNAGAAMAFAVDPNAITTDYTLARIAEVSIWDKNMSSGDETSIYNGGSGRAIY